MSGSDDPDVLICRELQFDPKQRTLAVKGAKVMLDPRSALVFQKLAENVGDYVSKDALLAAAWPGRLVHENSLAKAISRLRGAIAGSGFEIGAAYGFGYSLRKIDDSVQRAETPENIQAVAQAVPAKSNRRAFAVTAVLVALIIAAFAYDRFAADVAVRDVPPVTNDAPDALATILWVDDNPTNNSLEVEYFRERQIAVHLAQSTEDALKLISMNSYALVLSDLGRGENRLAGLDLIQRVKGAGKRVPIVIYTVRPKDSEGQKAQRRMIAEAGAADLALTPDEVRTTVLNRLAPRLNSAPKQRTVFASLADVT